LNAQISSQSEKESTLIVQKSTGVKFLKYIRILFDIEVASENHLYLLYAVVYINLNSQRTLLDVMSFGNDRKVL
jgi:hypothetical protein